VVVEIAVSDQENPDKASVRIEELLVHIEQQEILMRRMQVELDQLSHDLEEIIRSLPTSQSASSSANKVKKKGS